MKTLTTFTAIAALVAGVSFAQAQGTMGSPQSGTGTQSQTSVIPRSASTCPQAVASTANTRAWRHVKKTRSRKTSTARQTRTRARRVHGNSTSSQEREPNRTSVAHIQDSPSPASWPGFVLQLAATRY